MTQELEKMQELLEDMNSGVPEDEETLGMVCYLVSKDRLYNYTRLLKREFLKTAALLSFFSDDMMYSFQTVVKENKI